MSTEACKSQIISVVVNGGRGSRACCVSVQPRPPEALSSYLRTVTATGTIRVGSTVWCYILQSCKKDGYYGPVCLMGPCKP
eukprot:1178522-Prorocentrum_minimum.AAC.5